MKVNYNEKLFYEVYYYAARVTKMALLLEKGEISQKEYKEWAVESLKNLDDIKEWIKKVSHQIDRK